MNLSAYDRMEVNSKEPYISIEQRKLYLYDIPHKNYYAFLKRYDSENKRNDVFILLTDYQNNNLNYHTVYKKSDKTMRIDLSYIWFKSELRKLKETINVQFNLVNEQEDGEIYELVI